MDSQYIYKRHRIHYSNIILQQYSFNITQNTYTDTI